jgi:hypothetical protein
MRKLAAELFGTFAVFVDSFFKPACCCLFVFGCHLSVPALAFVQFRLWQLDDLVSMA